MVAANLVAAARSERDDVRPPRLDNTVSTVEQHLTRVYRKPDANRDDLPTVLAPG